MSTIYYANKLSTIFAGNADTDGSRRETDENSCKKKLHVAKKCFLPIFLRVTTSLDKAIIRLPPGGSSGSNEGKQPEGVLLISARSTTQSLAAAPVCQAAREEQYQLYPPEYREDPEGGEAEQRRGGGEQAEVQQELPGAQEAEEVNCYQGTQF